MATIRPTFGTHPRGVIFVDPLPLAREGLASLLAGVRDLRVLGVFGTRAEVEPHLAASRHDLLVLTVDDDSAFRLLELARSYPLCSAILALIDDDSDETGVRALRAGATAYLPKSASPTSLVAAMREVLALSDGPRFAARAATPQDTQPERLLTKRELEVFAELGRGLTSRQIAEALGLSVKTVATHRTSIAAKLGARSSTELTRLAVLWAASGLEVNPQGLPR